MKYIFYYQTQIGKVGITEENGKITNLLFESSKIAKDSYVTKETDVIKKAYMQLQEYFQGERKNFSLPLNLKGSEFMQKVWKALEKIPYGETRSYKQIAQAIGHPLAYRAVGMSNNKNPIPIFIPCHRVIGENKKLVGYGGGLKIKEYLLELETK